MRVDGGEVVECGFALNVELCVLVWHNVVELDLVLNAMCMGQDAAYL